MKKTDIHINLKIGAEHEFLIRHVVSVTGETRSDVMRKALLIGLRDLAKKPSK